MLYPVGAQYYPPPGYTVYLSRQFIQPLSKMPVKRRRTNRPIKKFKSSGVTNKMRRRVFKRPRLTQRVNELYRMIETKEGTRSLPKQDLYHNRIFMWAQNPFELPNGTSDPMQSNSGTRIGDSIAIKGLMIKAFFENALGRAKVFYRVMLIKSAKNDSPNALSTLFKGDSNNKMIDQVNTERYTIIAQKTFSLSTSNNAPTVVGGTGVPSVATPAGISSKIIKMWIPGRKFGRGGVIRYENESQQCKFFDYRIVILVYDWYGTPDGGAGNIVGVCNEMYTKLYFKDA